MASPVANPRQDSLTGFESSDKGILSSLIDLPDSPLSSVPSDIDDVPVPDDLDPISAPIFDQSKASVTPVKVDGHKMELTSEGRGRDTVITTKEFVRRSSRKRKAPTRFSQNGMVTVQDLDFGDLQLEEDVVSDTPAKRRRSDPEAVSKGSPKMSASKTRKKRISLPDTVKSVLLDTTPAVAPHAVAADMQTSLLARISDFVSPTVPTFPLSGILSSEPSTIPEATPSAAETPASTVVLTGVSATTPVDVPSLDVTTAAVRQSPTIKLKFGAVRSNASDSSENGQTSDDVMEYSHDHYLTNLSVALRQAGKIPKEEKPLPSGEPEIWAEKRNHLCESLPGLYESYHGACYGKNGIAKSFMIDGMSHSRDVCDENVIILRAGGGMLQDDITGRFYQSRDQDENSQSLSVRNTIVQKSPILVICGDRLPITPTQMPHRYNSLDWYKATHVWSEMDVAEGRGSGTNMVKIIKYRLEKLDSNSPSWWAPADFQSIVELGSLGSPVKHTCQSCNQEHEQMYLTGWMCLNRDCEQFWRLADGSHPTHLDYDPRFLKQKTPWPNEVPPQSIRFPLYVDSGIVGEYYRRENRRGLCCPDCGKCSSRVRWEGWYCDGCGFEHTVDIPLISAAHIQDQRRPVTDSFATSYDWNAPHIEVSVEFSYNYRWMIYRVHMPGDEIAEIVHGIANKTVREEPNGPNDMFEYLQKHSKGLVRRKLPQGHMNSFTMNYGMPYKFIAAGSTVRMSDAPMPVTETRSRLNWADKITSSTPVTDADKFNELYVVGYHEGQSMNYHDDGEEGLGGTIATLSLGAPAEMGFKPKLHHYTGVKEVSRNKKKMSLMLMDEPLPGSYKYAERKAAIAELRDAGLEGAALEKKQAEWAQKLGLANCKDKDRAKDWLRLWLGHGDIVIMRNSKLQKYTLHTVVPQGLMRYALTCRVVQEGHLKPEELPDWEDEPDMGHYDGSGIA